MFFRSISMPYKQFLGYRKEEKGEPEIVPEEAETVRRIYRLFLDGMTPYKIKLTLESEGILSPSGRNTWQPRTILSILTNEKYKGNALLQLSLHVLIQSMRTSFCIYRLINRQNIGYKPPNTGYRRKLRNALWYFTDQS